jgi:hypothetical protein
MAVSVLIRELVESAVATKRKITWEEYIELRLNSWDREFILPYLDEHALVNVIDIHVKNATQVYGVGPPVTYDEFIIHRLIPELVRRLKIVSMGVKL